MEGIFVDRVPAWSLCNAILSSRDAQKSSITPHGNSVSDRPSTSAWPLQHHLSASATASESSTVSQGYLTHVSSSRHLQISRSDTHFGLDLTIVDPSILTIVYRPSDIRGHLLFMLHRTWGGACRGHLGIMQSPSPSLVAAWAFACDRRPTFLSVAPSAVGRAARKSPQFSIKKGGHKDVEKTANARLHA